jgi:hypothetical protein
MGKSGLEIGSHAESWIAREGRFVAIVNEMLG